MSIINVLDHGFVRLVSYIQPVPEVDPNDVNNWCVPRDWTGDLEIIRNARVSHDADWRTGEDADKDERLMNRMAWHRHTSPKEAMLFTFEVKAPIFVFRQWHRHRTWSYNELSARYAPMQEEFYIPEVSQIRVQSTKDKQATSEAADPSLAAMLHVQMLRKCNEAFSLYEYMLRNNVARETARMVLPLNTYTRMFATVDLHNLFHFLDLRLDEHAQYEIRVYAQALLDLVRPICPVAVAKWESVPKPLTQVEVDSIGDLIDDALESPELLPEHFKAILESAARKLFPNRVKTP